MTWLFILLALGLIVALALVLSGRLPAPAQPTVPPHVVSLPDPPTLDDIDQLRFGVVFRGYRMQDVDAALAVLRERIADLEGQSGQKSQKSEKSQKGVVPGGKRGK